MEKNTETASICCPPFDPESWEDKVFEWEDKKFIKDRVFTLFYMPLNFGQVMRRLDRKVREAEAKVPDWLCLSEHTSKWNMNLYLAVDKELPGVENTTLKGKFFSKVYEGPFSQTGKWTADFQTVAESKGLALNKMFMWYTTCPKCAKKYGRNYVAIISSITN